MGQTVAVTSEREPRPERPARPRMKGPQRREQLLLVGRRLFAEKGFEATSVEEIASKANVSKPVVYEHFGGKEGLYAVVVDREIQALLGAVTSAPLVGGTVIYHAGDTIPYDNLADRVRAVADIDVALLPINGRRPERRVAGNLWGDEAAALAHAVGARLAVPMHYEMFGFNTEPPDAFAVACERLKQPYRVLRAGERLTLAQPD